MGSIPRASLSRSPAETSRAATTFRSGEVLFRVQQPQAPGMNHERQGRLELERLTIDARVRLSRV